MVKRLAVSICVAVGLLAINLPTPAIGSTNQPPGRVLINAPDPAYNLSPPALPAGAPTKHIAKGQAQAAANHVTMLSADAVGRLGAKGFRVITNRDGEWQVVGNIAGALRMFTVVDGVLPDGRQVVGFGTTAVVGSASVGSLGPLAVSADSTNFAICSYAWQNGYWDDLHIHLCAVDAAFVFAILLILETAVATLVGVLIGGPVGAVVGIAATTIASIVTIVYWWTHSDQYGNVDVVIPNWTMQPPYGGYIYWADVNLWDYMPDQCWIYDLGRWYAPQCSY